MYRLQGPSSSFIKGNPYHVEEYLYDTVDDIQAISLNESLAFGMIALFCPTFDTFKTGDKLFKLFQKSTVSNHSGLLGGRLAIAAAACEDAVDGSQVDSQSAYQARPSLRAIGPTETLVAVPGLRSDIFA